MLVHLLGLGCDLNDHLLLGFTFSLDACRPSPNGCKVIIWWTHISDTARVKFLDRPTEREVTSEHLRFTVQSILCTELAHVSPQHTREATHTRVAVSRGGLFRDELGGACLNLVLLYGFAQPPLMMPDASARVPAERRTTPYGRCSQDTTRCRHARSHGSRRAR